LVAAALEPVELVEPVAHVLTVRTCASFSTRRSGAANGSNSTPLVGSQAAMSGERCARRLAYKPTDTDNNIVASWHSYNFDACLTQSCWTS
jgi:hypothetical protein